MNIIESFFLDLGFSWTFSKLLSYCLMLLLGGILAILFYRNIKIKKRLRKEGMTFIIGCIPFILYFSVFPIYESDFLNNYSKLEPKETIKEFEEGKLYVISIPKCPFCYESIDLTKKIEETNPDLQVEYIVCGNSPSSVKWYQRKAGKRVPIRLAEGCDKILSILKNEEGIISFPTYVYVKNRQLYVWSNNDFGACAIDFLKKIQKNI